MQIKTIDIQNTNYPTSLKIIKNPPKILYVLGDESLLNQKCIAIVGSRHCTEYGIKHAKIFSKELANAGLVIVSGMALGIDTHAHRACIEVKGKTIAVLAGGFNDIYPKENIELFEKIIQNRWCSNYRT